MVLLYMTFFSFKPLKKTFCSLFAPQYSYLIIICIIVNRVSVVGQEYIVATFFRTSLGNVQKAELFIQAFPSVALCNVCSDGYGSMLEQ